MSCNNVVRVGWTGGKVAPDLSAAVTNKQTNNLHCNKPSGSDSVRRAVRHAGHLPSSLAHGCITRLERSSPWPPRPASLAPADRCRGLHLGGRMGLGARDAHTVPGSRLRLVSSRLHAEQCDELHCNSRDAILFSAAASAPAPGRARGRGAGGAGEAGRAGGAHAAAPSRPGRAPGATGPHHPDAGEKVGPPSPAASQRAFGRGVRGVACTTRREAQRPGQLVVEPDAELELAPDGSDR